MSPFLASQLVTGIVGSLGVPWTLKTEDGVGFELFGDDEYIRSRTFQAWDQNDGSNTRSC